MPAPAHSGDPLSVAVIGARQTRHGIGRFVATHLHRLGALVPAIVGTSPQSAAVAAEEIKAATGTLPRGFTGMRDLLAAWHEGEFPLDAVAICSPDGFHEEQLKRARKARLHVLCEKPLMFDGQSNPVEVARPVVAGFAEADRVLMVNEQWPYTLPGFDAVHPSVLKAERPPKSFWMLLAPGATGKEMIPNSLPHVFSMLATLHQSGGRAENIQATVAERNAAGEPTSARLKFEFIGKKSDGVAESNLRATAVTVDLQYSPKPPRPAAYAIDGHAVHRTITQPGYQMHFEPLTIDAARIDARSTQPVTSAELAERTTKAASRRVPLADPLPLLLRDFLDQCQHVPDEIQRAAENSIAISNLECLWSVYQAVAEELSPV